MPLTHVHVAREQNLQMLHQLLRHLIISIRENLACLSNVYSFYLVFAETFIFFVCSAMAISIDENPEASFSSSLWFQGSKDASHLALFSLVYYYEAGSEAEKLGFEPVFLWHTSIVFSDLILCARYCLLFYRLEGERYREIQSEGEEKREQIRHREMYFPFASLLPKWLQ